MRNAQRRIWFVVLSVLGVSMVLARKANAKPQDSQAQQNQSVIDAAKRSRELKNHAAPPARVITNDDLDKEHPKASQEAFDLSALTPPRTESSDVSAVAVPNAPIYGSTTLGGNDSRSKNNELIEAAAEDAAIAKLGAQLASAESALNWQQRELRLNQNTIYSNPRYATTRVGEGELDSARLQIEQREQEIERLKGSLADLEWRQWRRMQADGSGNYKSLPPSALVLP